MPEAAPTITPAAPEAIPTPRTAPNRTAAPAPVQNSIGGSSPLSRGYNNVKQTGGQVAQSASQTRDKAISTIDKGVKWTEDVLRVEDPGPAPSPETIPDAAIGFVGDIADGTALNIARRVWKPLKSIMRSTRAGIGTALDLTVGWLTLKPIRHPIKTGGKFLQTTTSSLRATKDIIGAIPEGEEELITRPTRRINKIPYAGAITTITGKVAKGVRKVWEVTTSPLDGIDNVLHDLNYA